MARESFRVSMMQKARHFHASYTRLMSCATAGWRADTMPANIFARHGRIAHDAADILPTPQSSAAKGARCAALRYIRERKERRAGPY